MSLNIQVNAVMPQNKIMFKGAKRTQLCKDVYKISRTIGPDNYNNNIMNVYNNLMLIRSTVEKFKNNEISKSELIKIIDKLTGTSKKITQFKK